MEYGEINDYELISQISDNEEATNMMFDKYRPLIISLANKFYTDNKNSGLDLSDLIQEAMIGFSIALNTYTENKDTLFFTYAKKCIESKLITSLVGANRQKHQILNSSISVDLEDEEFTTNLDRIMADHSSNPENILVDYENVTMMLEKLNQELTDFESQVFDLKKSGFTYKEIAEVLDVNPKKIDNALQRIKVKVKAYLSEQNKQ